MIFSEKQEIMNMIKAKHYETLRVSVFDQPDEARSEYQVRIEYDDDLEEYHVYYLMDRASPAGKHRFATFAEAKEQFLDLMVYKVKRNQEYVFERTGDKVGYHSSFAEYPSPLWDKYEKGLPRLWYRMTRRWR